MECGGVAALLFPPQWGWPPFLRRQLAAGRRGKPRLTKRCQGHRTPKKAPYPLLIDATLSRAFEAFPRHALLPLSERQQHRHLTPVFLIGHAVLVRQIAFFELNCQDDV
jgi:hypothetical protein